MWLKQQRSARTCGNDVAFNQALWPVYAQRYYISRAEPLLAVSDDQYYISHSFEWIEWLQEDFCDASSSFLSQELSWIGAQHA